MELYRNPAENSVQSLTHHPMHIFSNRLNQLIIPILYINHLGQLVSLIKPGYIKIQNEERAVQIEYFELLNIQIENFCMIQNRLASQFNQILQQKQAFCQVENLPTACVFYQLCYF